MKKKIMAGLMTLLMLTQYIPMPTQAEEEPLTIEMDPVDIEPAIEEALVLEETVEEDTLAWEDVTEMENITVASYTSGDFRYTVFSDGTATIVGFVGEESGDLVVPREIDGYPVIKIGSQAFYGCSGFDGTLTIPDSVISIGDHAFCGCSGFTGSLTIPDGVTSIGDSAFYNCKGFTGTLTIPDSVTSIGRSAFYGCDGFTGTLTISNSITSIGYDTFRGCSGFTGSLTIPDGVTSIGAWAFYGCSGFTGSLTLPDGITSIRYLAFSGCGGFTGSLTIPDGVTTIESSVFYGCSGFTGSLTIPDGVTTIERAAFHGCSGFTGSLTIPNSVTSIGDSAFYDCSGFTGSLTIPDGVTTIEKDAFYGCSGFTGSLTIPDSVTSIGDSAFYDCSGFTGSLTIPDGVTTIERAAFHGCSGFTGSLTIPNSVTSIGSWAFWCCSGFTGSLKISDCVTSIGDHAFYGCSGFTGSLSVPDSVTSIGSSAFYGCSGFTGTLTIPNSVTAIGSNVFWGCSGFTGSLTIPDGVTSIGECAFYNCSGFIGSLVIPNSVTSIGSSAFYGCSGFTGTLTIPNSVTAIGSGVFYNCSGFTGSLTIPNSVTSIGNGAFYNCSGFTGSLTIPNSVTSIVSGAFWGCSGFTGSLIIPDSVTSIGAWAFCGCSGFTGSLTIPGSVTSIGNLTFYNCSGLTGSLTIPNSVTSIGSSAFYGCDGLTGSLIIPNSVTSIGAWAFSGCSGFSGSLTIPNSVTSIGSYAFYDCQNITSVYFEGNVPTTWGDLVFADMSDSFTIYYPVNNTSGWTSPTWTAPDGSVYNTATYVPKVEPITTTWDTSPLTLSSGETYNFSGTISSVSPLDKLHIAVVRADNQSVGIDYYREVEMGGTFYDLSYVPSITAGDLLYGLQVTNNQLELSLTSGAYLIRMWITDTEGNYLDNLSKAITITDVSKAPVVHMLPITEVTASTATLQAEVVDTRGGIIVDYGFNLFTAETGGTHYAQYSASHADPSFRTAKYDPYDGVITVELQDYDPNQTYWVEAFAVYYEGDTRITGISATRESFTTDVATIAFTAPEPNATLSSAEVHVAGSIACQNEGITFSDLTLHLYDYRMQQVSTTACTLSGENTFSTTLDLTDAYGGTYYVTASVTTSAGKTIVSRPVGFHIPGKLTVYTDVALEENITATTATVTGSVEETLGEMLAYYGFRMYNGTEYIGMIFNQSDEPATYNAKTGVITAVLPADPGTTISYEAFVSYYADGVQIDSISHQRQTLTTKRVDIQLDRINNYKKDSYMLDDTAGALKIHGHLANIAADCTVGTPVVEVTDSSGNVKDTVTAVVNGTNFTATLDMSQYPVGVYTITAQVEDETGRVSVSNVKKAVMPQKATEITFKTNLGGEVLSQDEVHIIPHYKYLVVDLDIDTSRSDIDKIEWSTSSTSGLPLHVWNESEGYFDTKRPQTCQYTAVSCGKYTITATVYNHDGSTVSASLDVEVRAQAILCFVDYVTQTPLENVNVQITSKNDPSYSVQAKTNAAGQITLQDVTYGSYSIYATASGHNPLDIVQVIGDGSDMTIPVYDDDHIVYSANMTAVYTSESENIMTHDNVDILYTSTRLITGRDYLVSIRVVANASKTISKYQLIQDGKVLGESTSADTSIVLQSLRQCKKNKDVYIRVCYIDGTYKQEKTQLRFENTVFTEIANNLTNGDAGNMSLNLGNEFSVKLPDSVPIFGGQEMKLDLLDIPASFKVADNKVHIIIGAEDMFEDNSDKRDGALVWEAKKMGVQEDIINAAKAVKKAMSSGNLSSALDMLEKDLRNFKRDKMAEKEAKIFGMDIVPIFLGTGTYDLIKDEWEISIVMQVMIEWEKDFQYFPAGVPVVLTIKIETKVGSEGKLNLIKVVDETDATKTYWKADAREFYPVVSLGLTLGGGFGVSDIATITAEGKGEVEGKAKLSPELKIALEFNLHLQILVWEHIEELAGIEWKLEDGEWWTKTLYSNWTKVDTSESTLTNITALSPYNIPISQYTLSDRSYLNNTTDWYADNGVAAFASITDESYTTQMDTLMSYIYPDTQLQTVQTADNKVMVWLTDDATRDAANRTKLVYAVYDPVLEMWSVPQSVADDGTLDSYPCLTTDGTSIWAAWVNMGTALTDDMTLEDSMCQTEICVAMFDPQTMSFRHVTTLTQNTMIDLMPSITVSGDRIAVAWVNNDNGDLWGTSGTNTIYVSLYDGSTWSAPQVVKTLDTAVTDMKIGFVDGDLCVAYCCDTDNSLETIEDIAVSLIDLDTGVAYVLAETGLNASLQFTTIQNAQLLTWYATGSIMSLRTLGETPVDLLNGKSANSDYRIVSDVHGTVILCTVPVENGSELYVSVYDPIENAWSNNIRLTYQNNAYINDFGALMEPSGDITVMYTAESGDMAQMCSGTIQFIKDISLDSVSTALFDAIPGQMTSLYAEITNHGIATVESVVVQLRDGETILSEITMPLELAAGETMSLEVPVRAPATDGVREYTVAVLLPDEEIDDSNNISKVSFGYSSMSLSLTDLYGDEARLLQFTVTNNSGYDTNATLTLYKDDENRTVLDSIHVGTVAGKSNVQVSYTLTDLSESLYFVLEGDRTEYYLDDNEIYYDLSTNNGYAITGQITGNDPTKVATIQLLQNGVVIYTDTAAATDGTSQTFAITDVPDGIYTLVFSKQGHLPQTMENVVVNGADVALSDDIVMTAGDVDGNGVLDANDLSILKRYFVGYATDVDLSSYDVNGDGVFTRADVMYLARMLNAWENYAIPNRS